MPGKIKVGIVGCGQIARVSHLPGFNEIRDAEVSALYDVKAKPAGKCRDGFVPNAEVFTNFERFLDSGLDAVSICTPTVYHCEQTLAAFSKGLHVLCEKPISTDLKNATRMVNAARRAGKVLHINHSMRYNPLHSTVAKLIESGKIGKVLHMRCIRASDENPADKRGWSPGSKWFLSKKQGGGVLLDIGIHMVDLFKWFGGEVSQIAGDVRSLSPEMTADDSAVGLFKFANKATGVIELKWNFKTRVTEVEIYGTKGSIRYASNPPAIEVLPPAASKRKPRTIKPKSRAEVESSFQRFISAVKGKTETLTPGEQGRDALALCEAIQRSSESGKFEKVKKWKR